MSHKTHILALCQDLPPVFFLSPQPQKRPFHKRHQYSPRPIGLETVFFKIIQVGWSTLTFLFQLQNCWELFLDHINGRLSEWGCLQVDYNRYNENQPGCGASLGDRGRYFLIEINMMRTNLSCRASLGHRVGATESGGNLDRTLGARLLKHSQHFHLMTNSRI